MSSTLMGNSMTINAVLAKHATAAENEKCSSAYKIYYSQCFGVGVVVVLAAAAIGWPAFGAVKMRISVCFCSLTQ